MDHEVRKLTIMISDGFKFILTYDVGDNFFGKKITTLENILITVAGVSNCTAHWAVLGSVQCAVCSSTCTALHCPQISVGSSFGQCSYGQSWAVRGQF